MSPELHDESSLADATVRLAAVERLIQADGADDARGVAVVERIQRIVDATRELFGARRVELFEAGSSTTRASSTRSPAAESCRGAQEDLVAYSVPLALGTDSRLEFDFDGDAARLDALDRASVGLVAQRLALLSQLRRGTEVFGAAQRFEAIGRLVSGVAHDFNNALTAISGYLQLVSAEAPAGSTSHRLAERAMQSVRFATAMTRQLLDFSRGGATPELVAFEQVVANIDHLLRSQLGDRRRLVLNLGQGTPLMRAVPVALEQVLLNLVANSRDAMPDGGTVEITTGSTETDGQRFAVLSVGDDGQGIAADVLPHLFEPLFTTKPEGQGTGLGLAIVQRIISDLGGTVAVDSAPGAGSCFTIRIPAAR